MTIEEAVEKAMRDMPEGYILKPFLEAHRAEVKGMLLTEYNEMETMCRFERDGEKKGEKRGEKRAEKRMAALINRLISLGRVEDLKRASEDEDFRKVLFEELSI